MDHERRGAITSASASRRWQALMAAAGPFESADEALAASEESFDALTHDDWLEAFAGHADIGVARPGDVRGSAEQATVLETAAHATRAALARDVARYRARFGFPFLVRARGRGADEIATILAARIDRSTAEEFAAACAAEREIAALRIAAAFTMIST